MVSNHPTKIIALVLTICLIPTFQPVLGHPPQKPDHGITEQNFSVLWSGDSDGNITTNNSSRKSNAIQQLVEGTDIPLNNPPTQVNTWNKGEHSEFPSTNPYRSIHPPSTTTQDERFVKDAFISFFDIYPSTKAHISSTREPLFVGDSGVVGGVVDYRVRVPENDTDGSRKVYWQLISHQITSNKLHINGVEKGSTHGTHTPTLRFNELDKLGNKSNILTLTSRIKVRLEKHIVEEEIKCVSAGFVTNCYPTIEHKYRYPTETVEVNDRVNVTHYNLSVSGYHARFPDGDIGVFINGSEAWQGYSIHDSDVRGVWRFYSARNQGWDELVWENSSGEVRKHSPIHPLRIHAVPLRAGAMVNSNDTRITHVTGKQLEAPTLPSNVSLDTPRRVYNASFGLATRTETPKGLGEVWVRGLVPGSGSVLDKTDLVEREIHRSDLTLSVLTKSGNGTSIKIRLIDNSTGTPIYTGGQRGFVAVDGGRHNTAKDGEAGVVVSDSKGVVYARYNPAPWWVESPGHTPSSYALEIDNDQKPSVGSLFQGLVFVAIFLLAAYLIDRITPAKLWPPWRRL